MPPPAAAEVATAQLTGVSGVETADEGDEPLEADVLLWAGVLVGDDEHPAMTNASAVAPAQMYPRGTSLTVSSSPAPHSRAPLTRSARADRLRYVSHRTRTMKEIHDPNSAQAWPSAASWGGAAVGRRGSGWLRDPRRRARRVVLA